MNALISGVIQSSPTAVCTAELAVDSEKAGVSAACAGARLSESATKAERRARFNDLECNIGRSFVSNARSF